jgi:hypothetical protein
MSVANGSPTNSRALLDQNYIATANIPNAANTAATNSLNLVQAVPYPVTDFVDFQIVCVGGAGANNKNVNFWIQDSADNVTFANVASFAIPLLQSVDNSNTNGNSGSVTVKLPPSIRQYVRVEAQGEANGGAGTNGTFTAQLLF